MFFFYGTLAADSSLQRVIGAETVCHLGPAHVRGVLYDAGEYPALVLAGDADVSGVLIEIARDSIAALDAYEGLDDGLYSRRRVTAVARDGSPHSAWAYIYERPVVGLRRIAGWPPARDSSLLGLPPKERLHG